MKNKVSVDLFNAIFDKDEFKVKEILEQKSYDLNLLDEHQKAPIHYAVRQGTLEIVKMVVEAGADINLSDEMGTPLHHAIGCRNDAMAEWMISRGADLYVSKGRGQQKWTPLLMAISLLNTNIALTLIKHMKEVDQKDERGNTALFLALEIDNLPIAQALVSRGADVSLQNEWGQTPLEIAERKGNTTMINLIKEVLLAKEEHLVLSNLTASIKSSDVEAMAVGTDQGLRLGVQEGSVAHHLEDLAESPRGHRI